MSTSDTARILGLMNTYARERITKSEAAQLAGVTVRTIKRWAVAGRITEERDPRTGRPWYRRSEIRKVRNGRADNT